MTSETGQSFAFVARFHFDTDASATQLSWFTLTVVGKKSFIFIFTFSFQSRQRSSTGLQASRYRDSRGEAYVALLQKHPYEPLIPRTIHLGKLRT